VGAAALGSIAALILLSQLGLVAQGSALAFGLGTLLYSSFWVFAALMAPGLGGTGQAKDALELLAVSGAGLSVIGVVGTLYCVVKDALFGSR